LFVVGWGEHVEGGVAALAVVEGLDVLEHCGLELEPRRPGAAVDEFFLEGGEERLGDGVVVGVSAGAHRDRDPGLVRGPAERERHVLPGLNRSSQRCLSTRLYLPQVMDSVLVLVGGDVDLG
jgi:hypothetical protein